MRSFCNVPRADKCDCSAKRKISGFSDAECLIRRRPHPRNAFFKSPQFQRLLGDDLLRPRACLRSTFTSSVVAARAVSPASRFLPASRNSFDQF